MKKLAGKCLCMAAVLTAVLLLLGAVYRRAGIEHKVWVADGTENFRPVPGDIDVAVFGNSHGMKDFLFGPQGCTFFNFALSGQTPQYDLAMMHQYEENIKENALVILTVSYTSPYGQESEADPSFQEKQGRYYRLLDPENIIGINWVQYYLIKFFPILGMEPDALIGLIVRPEDSDAGRVFDVNKTAAEQERIYRDHWIEGIKPRFSQPVTWETYERMFSLCEKNGWRAVMVTPPYLKYYNDVFPEDFYPVFKDEVGSFAEKNGIPYFDYSHEEAFAEASQLYRDIDHLNEDGAKKFDLMFYADLQTAGVL